MKINIASNEVIHFIGIGGIGMSGLAQIMNNMGFVIQGSDLNRNKNTDRVSKIGVKVNFGHQRKNLNKATMIVISSAIKKKYYNHRISWKNNHNIFSGKYFS